MTGGKSSISISLGGVVVVGVVGVCVAGMSSNSKKLLPGGVVVVGVCTGALGTVGV